MTSSRSRHCIVASLLASIVGVGPALAQSTPVDGPATFNIFVRGRVVGSERVEVSTAPEGTTIRSSNRLAVPIDLTVRTASVSYDANWQPRDLAVEGMLRGQAFFVRTQFADGKASNLVFSDGKTASKEDAITKDAVALPSNFFGAYEALAARLTHATPGTDFRVYIAPQGEMRVTFQSVQPERVQVPGSVLTLRRHMLVFHNPSGPIPAEVWADERGRLARASVPGTGIDIVRDDIASVTARRQTSWRDNDVDIRVGAAGFTISGTLSRPVSAPAAARLPAVVLVAGEGTNDRDENVAGLPVFGQLASLLADRGFVVARYDRRGVGQSGGRAESGTVSDYAEDVRAVIKTLVNRPDVDPKRIVVVGHGQGAAVAMLAASREKRVAALVLLSGFSTTGADLVLEQQQLVLAQASLTEADRLSRVELQKRIHQAVLTGTGWDAVPVNMRAAADTAWFRSFLAFDAAKEITKTRQPILVIHGELDKSIPAHHAERLAQAANTRKRARTTEVHRLPGVNHILSQAVTGEIAEYATLANKQVTPEIGEIISAWTTKMLPSPQDGRTGS